MVARICPRNDIERQRESAQDRHRSSTVGWANGWSDTLSVIDLSLAQSLSPQFTVARMMRHRPSWDFVTRAARRWQSVAQSLVQPAAAGRAHINREL
jgi:hypothetical protein